MSTPEWAVPVLKSLEAIARRLDARRKLMRQASGSDTHLPIKPNLEYYQGMAKRQAKSILKANPLLKPGQAAAQARLQVARQHRYDSWPVFAHAIKMRNRRAAELECSVANRDEGAIRSIVHKDRDAVLDAGATAPREVLAVLIPFIQERDHAVSESRPRTSPPDLSKLLHDELLDRVVVDQPDPTLMTMLLNAVAERHPTRDLEDCLDLLIRQGADPEWAYEILRDRSERLPAGQEADDDRQWLDFAMGRLAQEDVYDSDFEYLPEDD